MIYVAAWSYTPENVRSIIARFKETGGLPPAGVKLLGRWHGVGTNKGVVVVESDDPVTMAKYLNGWADLASFDVYPALTDEDVAKSLL